MLEPEFTDIEFYDDEMCGRCGNVSPVVDMGWETPNFLCSTCMDILADELRKRSDAVAEDQARRRGELRNGK